VGILSALITRFNRDSAKLGRFALRNGLLEGIDGNITSNGSQKTQIISVVRDRIDSMGEPYVLAATVDLTIVSTGDSVDSVSFVCRFGRKGRLFEDISPKDVLSVSSGEIKFASSRVGSNLVAYFDSDGNFVRGDDHISAGMKFVDLSKIGLRPSRIAVLETIGNMLRVVPDYDGLAPLFVYE
jgi:hypothetical protein